MKLYWQPAKNLCKESSFELSFENMLTDGRDSVDDSQGRVLEMRTTLVLSVPTLRKLDLIP